jgi:parallel beta-helix repeat protein
LKTKIRTTIIVTLLLCSLIMPLLLSEVKADDPNDVTIKPDGSIIQSSNVISTSDQITYTLTDNFYGSITVQKSNIILNGADFTVSGSGSGVGVNLNSVNNVTLTRLCISNYQTGIWLEHSSNNRVTNNTIDTISLSGILLEHGSNYNAIVRNVIASHWTGIYLEGSESTCMFNTVYNNTVNPDTTGIKFANGASNNRAIDNKITGGVYGFIFDVAGANNAVLRNTISGTRLVGDSSTAGIFANYVYTNNTIAGNTIQNNTKAIELSSCSNFTIYANNFINNTAQVVFTRNTYANNWNYTDQGNYWSDYQNRYPAATDNSGIWSIAYVVEESIPNSDYAPLVNPSSPFILDITVAGSGSTSPDADVYCLKPGAIIEVSQTPVVSGEFYNWILDGVNSTGDTITINMDTDHALVASFRSVTFTLTIENPTWGKVFSTDTESMVGGTSVALPPGSSYGVYEEPESGYIFAHWLLDGEVYSESKNIEVQFDEDHTLAAVFIPSPLYILPEPSAPAPTTDELLWSYCTAGIIYSSPVVIDGVVYVNTYDGYVYAINASTATPIWRFNTGDQISFSPTFADGIVYVCTRNGYVYALDADTDSISGEEIWSYFTDSYFESKPTIVDGVLYVASGSGYVYAFNANPVEAEGGLLWTFEAEGATSFTPVVVDGIVYATSEEGSVYAIDAQNGELLWTFETNDYMYNSPVVAGGIVYVCSESGYLYALAADTENVNGEVLWTYETRDYLYNGPAVADGFVYICTEDGHVYALNATTQNSEGEVIWSYYADDYFYETPTVVDGVVYVLSDNGYLYALSSVTENPEGELLWEYSSDDYFRYPVIVADGVVYATTNAGYVYAFNATPSDSEGDLLWTYETGNRIRGGPAYADGVLYVTSTDSYLYAFAANSKIFFTAQGLADGVSWSVTFGGITQTSNQSVITFVVCPNGEYNYSIEVPDGYSTNSTLTGTIPVNGTDVTTEVVFVPDAATEYTLTAELYIDGELVGTQNNVYEAGRVLHGHLDELPPQWTFSHICLDGVNITSTEFSLTMDQNHILQVFLNTAIFQLNISTTTAGGSVDVAGDRLLYQYGEVANLTAVADPGYAFTRWMIDNQTNSTDNPLAVVMDGNHTITAVFTEVPTTIIASDSNQTYIVRIEGNITAHQMTNMTITPHQENATTNVEFTVTGPSGTTGYGTIILPKTAIPYGSTPLVYIDGALAENQSYTEDADYFYISYLTHFSTHDIRIVFSTYPLPEFYAPSTHAGGMTPTNHTFPSTTPTPTPIPTPNPTATPQPTINPPTKSGNTDLLVVAVAAITLFVIVIGLFYRKKHSKSW